YTKQTSPSEYGKLVTESRKLCEEGRYDKAFKNLVNAVTLTDKNSRALGVLGYCYLKQNESLEAIPVLIQAIRRNPEEPLLFYRLGIAYCNLNNYNLGIANLKKSININPGYADFYQKLAECYSKAGNEQDAKKYLDLIKEITPINVTPLESLY
ncbi:tetratricopeptide repeat protein, partial [Candidatus Woesearchaeota archaeon]|nr:tetratricopeptide repeat protein [Candidatus Woesearchaeota archaeon]